MKSGSNASGWMKKAGSVFLARPPWPTGTLKWASKPRKPRLLYTIRVIRETGAIAEIVAVTVEVIEGAIPGPAPGDLAANIRGIDSGRAGVWVLPRGAAFLRPVELFG